MGIVILPVGEPDFPHVNRLVSYLNYALKMEKVIIPMGNLSGDMGNNVIPTGMVNIPMGNLMLPT